MSPHRALFLCVLLFGEALLAASASPGTLMTIHKRAPPEHNEWDQGLRADPDLIVPVQIDLAERSTSEAADALVSLSDPSSSTFGRYWSASDVTAAFALPRDEIKAVLDWVEETANVPRAEIRLSACLCRVDFNITVRALEKWLATEYFTYTHKTSGETSLACREYRVPENLLESIDFIIPTVFPVQDPVVPSLLKVDDHVGPPISLGSFGRHALSKRQRQMDCNQFNTPQCLREWYGIPFRNASYPIHPNNTFGIYQPATVAWLAKDLDLYFDTFEPQLSRARPVMQRINGGHHDSETFKSIYHHIEPNLDFQYAMALTWPQPVMNIQVGDKYVAGNLNNMLAAYDDYYCDQLDPEIDPQWPNPLAPDDGYQSLDCGTHTPPKVISVSYAWAEAGFPEDYLRRQCDEYLKLGLMGITIIAGTGDEGTAGRHTSCDDPAGDGKRRPFHVSFPASCPWVTAVGGTMKNLNSTNSTTPQRETVYVKPNTSSTGGFSSVFSAPRYQTGSTKAYLAMERRQLHCRNITDLFDPRGRGVPDISALATDYLVALNGEFRRAHGTSASTPIIASMISMINNERLLAGKGPVGFINPVLYKHPDVFDDVAHGENTGCEARHGFRAVKGWDAATGLGSPSYEGLLELFMSLP
ncbi:peptidase S8/S53 domain-containing protein [Chaetomium sp. MPI-CAGE-AT-0009]|nr:peptidase S8/S53 domain-containing protein [Chaetomium sp. MPI-CAGE-AT-0009]